MGLPVAERVERIHTLKTWPLVFDALLTRAKSFEVRRDDRSFRVGDVLRLREWDPDTEQYTGRSMNALVTYTLKGGQFGIEKGFVVMSIKRLP